MRTIIILILLAPLYVNAYNWMAVDKTGSNTVYMDKAKCETTEVSQCFDIDGKDLRYFSVQSFEVDDTANPLMKSRYNSESCADTNECGVQLESKVCDDADSDYSTFTENILLPGYSSYCTGLLGYEKKNINKLTLNESTMAQILAEDISKKTYANALDQIKSQMDCGKTVKAVMAIRNNQKNLTSAQIVTFVQTYAAISALLDSGALDTAKIEIGGLAPDGVLTTDEDKTAIVSQIDGCLGL